jgi:membrane fusion protein, copper/silver efflux system
MIRLTNNRLPICLTALLPFLLLNCHRDHAIASATPAAAAEPAPRTAIVAKREFAVTVEAPGVIDFNSRRLCLLTPRAAGRLETVFAYAGEHTAAGQVLAEIYSSDFLAAQAEFLQIAGAAADHSEARLLPAARERLRLLGMRDDEIARLQADGRAQTLMRVRAPFAGTVIDSTPASGGYVIPETVLFRIADLSTVWLMVDIPELEAGRIQTDCSAEVRLAPYPDEVFSGRLTVVGATIGGDTRTMRSRVELRNPDGRLKPGMYATARIRMPAVPVLAVPEEALRIIGGREVVFVQTAPGEFLPRQVKTGRRIPGWVEIVSGLDAGKPVATSGSFSLKAKALQDTFAEE